MPGKAKRSEAPTTGNTVSVVDKANEPVQSGRFSWLRAGTTPDRLQLTAIAAVFIIVAVGVASWVLTDRLVNDTTEVATSTGEVLIATQQISASFAEADTAAAAVHLAGADGNREQRRLYEQAMDRATSSLEDVARVVGDDEISHQALQSIAGNTTDYAGLIDAARLASIQDLAAANSQLSQASALNRNEITSAVQQIADRARDRFDTQTQAPWYFVAIIALAIGLALLIVLHLRLSRQFRRVLNLPIALAAVVLLVMVIMSARGFANQQAAFNDAEEQAFDAIQVSEQIQQIAYRHRALGTSSILNGQNISADLTPLEDVLAASNGLFGQALSEASSTREVAAAEEIVARWDRYVIESDKLQGALRVDNAELAERIAQGSANAAFNGFNTSVEAALLDNREQFLGQLQTASDSLRWLRGLILLGSLLAALLTWWGFAQRIGEYR